MIDLRILIADAACLALIQGAGAVGAGGTRQDARGLRRRRSGEQREGGGRAQRLSAHKPRRSGVDQEKPAIPRSEFRGLFKTYREVGKCLVSDRLRPEKTPQDKKTGNWLVDCGGNLVLSARRTAAGCYF